MRPEATIEKSFYTTLLKWAVKECIPLDVIKLNVLSRRGWPDRMILWWPKNVLFVEFKAPGEVPRPLQVYVHTQLRRMGFTVLVYDNVEEALEDVKTIVRATTAPNESPQSYDDRAGSEDIS